MLSHFEAIFKNFRTLYQLFYCLHEGTSRLLVSTFPQAICFFLEGGVEGI